MKILIEDEIGCRQNEHCLLFIFFKQNSHIVCPQFIITCDIS